MEQHFIYPSKGPGRPQILLIGNGLEYKSGQKSWGELLAHLTVADAISLTQEQRDSIPFPMLYQLLSTHAPVPSHLSPQQIREEEQRLAAGVGGLHHASNGFLDALPGLEADHIMTTNYSYCLEKALFPRLDFTKSSARTRKRLRLGDADGKKEINYKLHSCYLAKSGSRQTGLWHIHGECAVPKGIVLSYDRYGRLLQRIEEVCSRQHYSGKTEQILRKDYTSWPELFLYGDVYILGLGMEFNEFDLWWLLRRKQREHYGDGRTYFYERRPTDGFTRSKHLMLQANGVILCDAGCTEADSHDAFYAAALEDIGEKIAKSRKNDKDGDKGIIL